MSEHFILNLIIGLIAGVLAGMFGIGGGVVIVPALVIFSQITLIEANGTSLAALLLPVGIFAVIAYYRAGYINIRIGLLVAAGLLVGVIFGSLLALSLQTNILKLCYGFFLLYVCWSFFKPKELFYKYILKKKQVIATKVEKSKESKVPVYYFLLLGFFAGILSGMFGVGGGVVIVPFLMLFMKFDTKKAVGTSLMALLLPVGLPGVFLYYNAGHLNIGYAAPVALGLLIGAIFGAKITISLPTLIVKRIYSVFLLLVSINFIYQSIFGEK